MKVLRLSSPNHKVFILPQGRLERVALYLRGWRPAILPFVPLEWWEKPKKPKHDLAILLFLKIALGITIVAWLYAVGAYAVHAYDQHVFWTGMQEKYPPRKW